MVLKVRMRTKIVRFLRFDLKDNESQVWDIAEVRWYESVNRSALPNGRELRDAYESLTSMDCSLLNETSKKNSNDYIATTQIIFNTDIIPIPIKSPKDQKIWPAILNCMQKNSHRILQKLTYVFGFTYI